MVLVTRTSQLRSLVDSNRSAVAKNLTLFAAGLPSGFNSLAATSAGMSCCCQLSTHAACSAVRRAGNWPSSIKNRCWSSLISIIGPSGASFREAAGFPGFGVNRFNAPLVVDFLLIRRLVHQILTPPRYFGEIQWSAADAQRARRITFMVIRHIFRFRSEERRVG